ncbi:rhodanese-like domain-containing protein [Roseisolibacter sp. H3M3-2]|uniref:rhodanese-like domain-containing protein n=1 Tax=Roseisolibacter sp. H3M3-2 TaxID=3031323 RepID=UPI0023DC687D|nr:rhodanese-like domain-containing protein [Roseisolibacter sp. H3M3-2]MDF1505524.1 rhodanese-like domain-containing protein [Roseisolibacter sp. H3M3-2]
MLLQRFYDVPLAQASWLVGCQATGEALVVDPARDPAPYLAAAAAAGLRVTHVTETHIHADFVSGARELARRAGARLFLSAEGGPDWQYAYAAADGATLLRDGDEIVVGNVRVRAMHTPGHTPEHLTFLVTDGAAADAPMGACTGDFVFVGDVGRPDLLERAAGHAGTMEAGARTLFASLRRFKQLPDWLQLWPGHGAGSACGKALGAVPTSTLGYERRYNWALQEADEGAFVRAVLEGQPDPPRYFARMKAVNRDGPPVLGAPPSAPRLEPARALAQVGGGATVVDVRPAAAFARAHVPGTLNVPRGGSFLTWAGWLLPYDADVVLLAAGEDDARAAVAELSRIGIDRVAGWCAADDALAEWTASGRAPGSVPQTDVRALAEDLRAGAAAVVDVRAAHEWDAGHLPGATHVPLGHLAEHLAELPRDRPVVLQCQGGSRSAIGASLLRAHGFTNVVNLAGGYSAWRDAGLPIERDVPVTV